MDVYWKIYLEKGKKCILIANIKVKIFDQVYEDIIYFIFIVDGRRNRNGYLKEKKGTFFEKMPS